MPSLIRLNYFTGQILSAADLELQQNYAINRLRRHNRVAHGSGVAGGLTVTGPKGRSAPTVIVSPGAAIDPLGNEIELDQPQTLPVTLTDRAFLVVVRQVEQPIDPTPVLGETSEVAFAHIEETSVAALVADADPTARAPGDLVLARFVKARTGWRRDPKVKAKRLR